MSILSSISHIASEIKLARARHLTERSIRSLPLELQKDIGWPDAFETQHKRPNGVGLWAGSK